MRPTILAVLLCVALSSPAQQTSSAAPPTPAAHQAALQLVALSGMSAGFVANEDKMIAAGRDAMVKQDPTLNPAFVEEWGKRMKQRLNPDEFVAMTAHVWESHFTEAELQTLVQGAKDHAAGKEPVLPADLKEKVAANLIAIQSEMIGAFSQIGAKIGGQVGLELQKEHPEWFKAAQPAAAKP